MCTRPGMEGAFDGKRSKDRTSATTWAQSIYECKPQRQHVYTNSEERRTQITHTKTQICHAQICMYVAPAKRADTWRQARAQTPCMQKYVGMAARRTAAHGGRQGPRHHVRQRGHGGTQNRGPRGQERPQTSCTRECHNICKTCPKNMHNAHEVIKLTRKVTGNAMHPTSERNNIRLPIHPPVSQQATRDASIRKPGTGGRGHQEFPVSSIPLSNHVVGARRPRRTTSGAQAVPQVAPPLVSR